MSRVDGGGQAEMAQGTMVAVAAIGAKAAVEAQARQVGWKQIRHTFGRPLGHPTDVNAMNLLHGIERQS